MNIKICGEKNELDENEKIEFQEKLGNKYKIYSQLGRTGVRTSAYLAENEDRKEFVLKLPNDCNDNNWITEQKNAIEKCHSALNGYNGNVYIPTPVIFGDNFIIEPYAGEEFTANLYDAMPEDDKNKVTDDFAYFFYYLHTNNNTGIVSSLQMFGKPTLEEALDYLQKVLDEKQKNYLQKQIKRFNDRNISDEISVMTHADIRSQNVLYDKKQSKLAVIDFELLGERNIYHDFVPFAAASFRLSYKLLSEIIGKYNLLSKNSNISVSGDKIKLFHILGVFHEYGRCAIFRNDNENQLKNVCQKIFNCIGKINSVML